MTEGGAPLAPGVRVAEFEILRLLGAGGFGVTYLARDTSLACDVAVKEYFPARCAVRRNDGTVGPRSRAHTVEYRWGLERFLREARLLARFDDRWIVRVRRVFEAGGTAYLAMEYVEGRSLAAELKDVEKLPEPRVRALMEQLAAGLEIVHAAGLVHRDIKPGNVMLREDGTPVLIDFGTANEAFGEQSELVQITPPYAPIEQYGSGESSRRRLGPWTDVYALGAVAYKALSGRPPAEAVERVPVDRMAPLGTVAPGVSERFAAAVMAALALDAEDRPQTVAAWRTLWDDAPEPAASRSYWWPKAALGLAAVAVAAVFWIANGLQSADGELAEAGDVVSAETAAPGSMETVDVTPGGTAVADHELELQGTALADEPDGSLAVASLDGRSGTDGSRAQSALDESGGALPGDPVALEAGSAGATAATDGDLSGEAAPRQGPDARAPLASFRDDCTSCPELVVLPAGAFVMGSDLHDSGATGTSGAGAGVRDGPL